MAPSDPNRLSFDGVDITTAKIIRELLLSDLQAIMDSAAPEAGSQLRKDAALAASLLQQDLENTHKTTISDRRMAQSIAEAVQSDAILINRATQEEQIASQDHAFAEQLQGTRQTTALPAPPPATIVDDDSLSRLSALYISAPGPGGATTQCISCGDSKPSYLVAAAPCNHNYCQECLLDLFQASFSDESLFPPRCCRQPIIIHGAIAILLTQEVKLVFEQKRVEFGSPNQMYCSQAACARFIRPENITGDIGQCSECGTSTCIMCRGAAHDGDCPSDAALQQLLDLAAQNGWRRCNACGRMVELDMGCNHMTCKCRAEFCYVCGSRWKTCACPQWHEPRLFARANQIVDRDQHARGLDEDQRAAHVVQVVHNLRERHECEHTTWSFVRGMHVCEECNEMMPTYIFQCDQCHMQACNRCRRNRI